LEVDMQEVNECLDEVKDLYRKVVGTPPPEIRPDTYAAFQPGVDPVHHAIEEAHHLKTLSDWLATRPAPTSWIPAADCFTADDAYVIHLEIPGVQKEELKVHVAGGECVISGNRTEPERGAMQPLNVERAWGRFERRFGLPPGSHPDKVTAKYRDGVLEVRVAVEGFVKGRERHVDVA
jgi:HSP20 family protein